LISVLLTGSGKLFRAELERRLSGKSNHFNSLKHDIMKRLSLSILILTILLPLIPLHAQTWKTKIQRVSGSERTKTLRLKPGISVSVGSLLLDNDSLKEAKYYDGKFHSGSRESITLKLNSVKSEQSFTNGIKFRSEKPVQLLALEPGLDSGLYSIFAMSTTLITATNWRAGWRSGNRSSCFPYLP
jgi:hypothetical protein